jgi:hypothetical protein
MGSLAAIAEAPYGIGKPQLRKNENDAGNAQGKKVLLIDELANAGNGSRRPGRKRIGDENVNGGNNHDHYQSRQHSRRCRGTTHTVAIAESHQSGSRCLARVKRPMGLHLKFHSASYTSGAEYQE